jgi:hypothetical protein
VLDVLVQQEQERLDRVLMVVKVLEHTLAAAVVAVAP